MKKINKFIGMDELMDAGFEINAGDTFTFKSSNVRYNVKFVKFVYRNTSSKSERLNGEWVTTYTKSKVPILEFEDGRKFSTMPWQARKLVTEIIEYKII